MSFIGRVKSAVGLKTASQQLQESNPNAWEVMKAYSRLRVQLSDAEFMSMPLILAVENEISKMFLKNPETAQKLKPLLDKAPAENSECRNYWEEQIQPVMEEAQRQATSSARGASK